MSTRYEYKVTVDHYVEFYDEDVAREAGVQTEYLTDEHREAFAQSHWGGDYDTDFDCANVEECDTTEEDD